MGLSFYYEFMASVTTTARELETFLRGVEQFAQTLGFEPTLVLDVPFDTPERRPSPASSAGAISRTTKR
jgi:hypothetical protein